MLQHSKNKFSSLSLCLAPFSPCAFNCLFFLYCIKCKLLRFIFKVRPSLFCSLSYFLRLRRGVPAFCWLSLHHLLIKFSNKWLCVFSYLSPHVWKELPVSISKAISLGCFRNPSLKLSFAEMLTKKALLSVGLWRRWACGRSHWPYCFLESPSCQVTGAF